MSLKKKTGFAGISKPVDLMLTFQILYQGQAEHETSTLLKYFRFTVFKLLENVFVELLFV